MYRETDPINSVHDLGKKRPFNYQRAKFAFNTKFLSLFLLTLPMRKRVIIAITVAMLLAAYHVKELVTPSLSRVVDRYVESGNQLVLHYQDRVRAATTASLDNLFEELDRDGDGSITKAEFYEARMRLLAALAAVDIPNFPEFSPSSIASWFGRVVSAHFAFLTLLFLSNNLYYVIFGYRHSFDAKVDYKSARSTPVGLDVALKYDTPWNKRSWYDRLKTIFFICTGLIVTRFILATLGFVMGVAACNMAAVGGRNRKRNPKWFAFWRNVLGGSGWVLLHAMGFHHVPILGAIPDGKIIIGNHVCVIEAICMFCHVADMPSFVSRIENLSIPFMRGVVQSCDGISVDRDAAASRTKTLEAIKERATNPKTCQLMLFPEGTTSNQLTLFQFKKGAFEPGMPVQMVCFKYPYKHFNPCWTGRPCGGNDMIDMLVGLACQFSNYLEVMVLPVYEPTHEEKNDALTYASHCQQMMAAVLKENVSDATYADYVNADPQLRKGKKVGHSTKAAS